MKRRLSIIQNRPTQFDMPLYTRMWQSGEWDLQVIYTETDEKDVMDHELGHAPRWDHVPTGSDLGIYLTAEQRKDVQGLADQIAAHQPDLVVLCGYYPRLHARLVGPLKRRGIRIGLRSDNTLPHGDFSGFKGLAKRLLLPFWLARYDTWHPVGTLARAYLQKMSITQRPVFPFSYTADVEWFEQQSAQVREQRAAHRAALGLAGEHFVVLGIMKWHPREDPLTLLRAFRQLHESHPKARLLLVGDGPLHAEVTEMAEAIGAAVLLPGYQPYSKLPLYYAISDVFVHPSVDEPWGVSVQEALACGLPVLVAEGVGSRFDLLEEGVTGWVFPDGDAVTLANWLGELARDDALQERMGAVAGKYAHKMDYDYTLAQFSAAIEEGFHRH